MVRELFPDSLNSLVCFSPLTYVQNYAGGHSSVIYGYSSRNNTDGEEVVEYVTKFQIGEHFSS